jgi:hypothetical protein
MTDTQQPNQPSEHRKVLEGAFSPAIVDAFDGRIKEVSNETFAVMKAELTQMIEEHKATISAARQLPASERAAVTPAVDETTDKLKTAATDLNEMGEQLKAGQSVEPQKVEKAVESADEAGKAVDQSKAAVDARVDRHEAILAPRKGSKRDNRVEDLEDDVAGIRADVDQLKSGHQELMVVSATAFAQATANDDGYATRRAGMAALIAFCVTFPVYLLILLGPAEWDWNWAIGLPAVMAGLVAAIVWALSRQDGPAATSVAAANAIVTRWNEQDDAHQQDDDNDYHPVFGSQQPVRGATAVAGARAHT